MSQSSMVQLSLTDTGQRGKELASQSSIENTSPFGMDCVCECVNHEVTHMGVEGGGKQGHPIKVQGDSKIHNIMH